MTKEYMEIVWKNFKESPENKSKQVYISNLREVWIGDWLVTSFTSDAESYVWSEIPIPKGHWAFVYVSPDQTDEPVELDGFVKDL